MNELLAIQQRRILLAVTGSVAAYKAVLLYRQLTQAGADVRVILSHSASQFIGAASFSAFGAKVYSNMWSESGEQHVELGAWAECIVVAPATADVMARIRYGRAEELLTATLLCSVAPLFVAPAMHPDMWQQEATQENIRILRQRGAKLIGPVEGLVASGDSGKGRFIEPSALVSELARLLSKQEDLKGKHLLLSAGPTVEKIDPVRAITNLSSGKMGYALAEAAHARGAQVTLVSGPVALTPPDGVKTLQVQSAEEMLTTLQQTMSKEEIDCVIMAAAVADFRIENPEGEKRKKDKGLDDLRWVENPDIIATLARQRTNAAPFIVGFALESADGPELIELARRKLRKKGIDLVVANSAKKALGHDDTEMYLVDESQAQYSGKISKRAAAEFILDSLVKSTSLSVADE